MHRIAKKNDARWLSNAEVEKIVHAIPPCSTEEVMWIKAGCILDWALNVRIAADMIERVLKGDLLVDWKNDEPAFLDKEPKRGH
jgi:hypothetical protein